MSNPYSPLIRMVELRIKRQEVALSESKLQLDAAKAAYNEYEEGDRSKQVDLLSPGQLDRLEAGGAISRPTKGPGK